MLRRDSGVGLGGALAIPINPIGGYRRSAPPPTLQFYSNEICSDTPKLAAGLFIRNSGSSILNQGEHRLVRRRLREDKSMRRLDSNCPH
jgi:hypothetical protein